jgi:hypothetical protein
MPRLRILAVMLIAAAVAWTAVPVSAVYGGQAGSQGAPGQMGEPHPVIRAAIKELNTPRAAAEQG